MGDFFRVREAQAAQKDYDFIEAKAKSIIHIFCPAASPIPKRSIRKPYSPLEYRGELGTIPTKVPGEVFCETLPHTAQIADKITVIRSMSHGEAAHERGTHNMFTGYKPSPALIFPSMGSVVSHEYGPLEQPAAAVRLRSSRANEFARDRLFELVDTARSA